jgi:hypothetical protein
MNSSEAPATDPGGEARQPRGRPFERGRSGNPNGRPKGSRNKATVFAQELLDGQCEALLRKLTEKALGGDTTALRLCLERLLPPRRDRLVSFELPKIETAADACTASAAIVAACANGELTPREATEFMSLVATHGGLLEATELEKRLAALEAQSRASP